MTYELKQTAKETHVSICLPASKSICNRALVINALAGGQVMPSNLSDCDDTRVMVDALSCDKPVIDIKAAGTAIRFLTAYYSSASGTRTITGTERMKHRPISVLVDALRLLGADISYSGEEGFPPLTITGRTLKGGNLQIPGNVSSQYISALMMIGATLPEGLRLTLTGDIISRPYINLTMGIMRHYGDKAVWENSNSIVVSAGGYSPNPFSVENDWSAASYWYETLALKGDGISSISLPGLDMNSLQGDSKGAMLFEKLGVSTIYNKYGVTLKSAAICPASRLDEDFSDIPDLAQTFTVTCCVMGIPFFFSGLKSLRIKETDRISALMTELKKLGYVLNATDNGTLSWSGERCQPDLAPTINTYEDHRMAMSFAPACIKVPGLRISNPDVVSKSYPSFWKDFQTAGFSVGQG